ncbi:MAG: ABC transporter ATP-binding protein, partial [Caldilineaceae bacterium]|nr:ABC transporter ATP-binding protein [Caldilineaceae bacterium]
MAQQGTSRPNAVRFGVGGGGNLTGDSATNTRSTVRRLLTYLRPYRGRLLLVAGLVILSTAGNLAGPILLGRAIDNYVIPKDMSGLTQLALTMLAVYIGVGLCAILQGRLMVGVGQGLVADIRAQLFGYLQHLSMAYHDSHSSGDLMSRVTNDTEAINRALSDGLIEFTGNILLFAGIMVSMFVLNWQLALGTVTVLPIMLWITALVTKHSRVAFRQVQRNLGNMNGVMEENIAGIRVVKAFAREADTLEKFTEASLAYRKVGVKADIITAALGPMFTTMSTLTISITALLGGWLALRGLVEVGVIATFVIYIMNFFRPMRAIAMLYNGLQSAMAGAERIFAVLDTAPTVQDAPDAQAVKLEGAVKFENVSFEYTPGKPVLIDVSLEAQPGQTIALVGPTGAGKTTIISLLSRFYDATAGAIWLDGRDLRQIKQDSLRQQLGIVL